ncbi:MAG: hypothetical protein NUV84_03885 [Candidatus Uhrbacteria bacterium]|nr:hypothetical protein [Candidatus Uhrbacteria bacterium]
MATPEEQKATLHANRLARPVSPTPSPSPANVSTQPHDRRSALQSSRLRAFTTATALPLAPSPSNQTPQQEETLQAQQAQRLAGIQAGINAQTQQQAQSQKSQQGEEQTQQQREEVKKVAKAAMRRGLMFIINGLTSALSVGTYGIGFIITFPFQLFSLGILNLEMIYGKYFAKGKSRWVAPLSWDPIPMPIDKDALILSGFIVAMDIAFGVAILALSFGGFCLIHDFV